MRSSWKRTLLMLTILALPAAAQTPESSRPPSSATYVIDTVHSEVSFRIRHLLGRVAGTFGDWGGTVVLDSLNSAENQVDVTIQTASIDTRVQDRDNHLRTADFFAADSFPIITFQSTDFRTEGNHVRVSGDLTIRGRTRPVTLTGTYEGTFPDPWGGTRVAFIASTMVNRHDFGVSYDGPFLDIGQIGDEVQIEIAIEAVRQ